MLERAAVIALAMLSCVSFAGGAWHKLWITSIRKKLHCDRHGGSASCLVFATTVEKLNRWS